MMRVQSSEFREYCFCDTESEATDETICTLHSELCTLSTLHFDIFRLTSSPGYAIITSVPDTRH